MSKRITITDIRRAGFCASGARRLFQRHGVDFNEFLKNGITEKRFLDTGEGFARLVVDRKKERESRG